MQIGLQILLCDKGTLIFGADVQGFFFKLKKPVLDLWCVSYYK